LELQFMVVSETQASRWMLIQQTDAARIKVP
jgi:hypothetical protein